MRGTCIGDGIVIGTKFTFGLVECKKGAVVYALKLQKIKEVSAALLHQHGT